MDFQTVLERLLDGFDSRKIRYATIGGFALGALGAARATKDLDFLVHRSDDVSQRRTLDSADIEALAELHGATLDWDEVREYYELFGLAADFEKLRERFGHAQ